jgi:hypothetical protein
VSESCANRWIVKGNSSTNKSRGCYGLREWTGEIEEMFKEGENKYTRIHGIEITRWLRCEINHQRGQRKGKMGF